MQAAPVSKGRILAGRILSALTVLALLFGCVFAVFKPEMAAAGFAHYGYPQGTMLRVIVIEMVCVIVYAIPRTSVLGAILITGYFGGAVATHLRLGEPVFAPVLVAVVAWAGIYLREERLRALLPWRS